MENDILTNYDFYQLFSKNKEEILKNDIKFKYEEKEIDSSSNKYNYISSFEEGTCFCFKNNDLESIFLYGNYDKKYRNFKGNLPYNLNYNFTAKEIVSKFGEPDEKLGKN